jgi:hypothetical protein
MYTYFGINFEARQISPQLFSVNHLGSGFLLVSREVDVVKRNFNASSSIVSYRSKQNGLKNTS